jgi:septum formation protein
MLVLASASPRRQELLRNAGIPFVVQAANISEEPRPQESARSCAERLALEKARAVFSLRPRDIVLGADTVVEVGVETLGKPRDADDAVRILRLLSGKTHEVTTGVCLIGAAAMGEQGSGVLEDVRSATTVVTMAALNDEEIRAYVSSGEPMDKAGAYAIQGMASRWISRIEGDYFNVVGLPVALVWRMLREHGR